tara:strand:- start:42 stop:308 length:267 start_codon:yes stop_codon:yes gene_type:complete
VNLSLRYKKIRNLAEMALKDVPEYKPLDGYSFLEDVPIGTIFTTGTLEGVKINDSINPVVLVYDGEQLGKRSFAGKCEIQIITEGGDE